MSQKRAKQIRRIVRKEKVRIIADLIKEIKQEPFMERLKIALNILRGRVK